jgi:uncharacterized protein YdaU (DUF1376 family)
MDWYPWFPSLFRADTMHLTAEEDGIYRRLIDHYMETRQPLPDNDIALARIAGISQDVWAGVSKVIRAFFQSTSGRLVNARCNTTLSTQDSKNTRRTEKSIKGAKTRWKIVESNRLKRSERLSNARAIATHTKEEWALLLEICKNCCCKCSDIAPLVKDHITPLYQGGNDGIENLQPLCRRCNSSKGPENKDYRPHDWKKRLLDAFLCSGRGEEIRGDNKKDHPAVLGGDKSRKVSKYSATEYPPDFESFWKLWPAKRRCEKPNAYKAWKEATGKASADAILKSVAAYVKSEEATKGFAPYPAKWLKAERWSETHEAVKKGFTL